MKEIWAIKISDGFYLPPIDDDDCECFMAFPSKADADEALVSQKRKGYIDDDKGVVVKVV